MTRLPVSPTSLAASLLLSTLAPGALAAPGKPPPPGGTSTGIVGMTMGAPVATAAEAPSTGDAAATRSAPAPAPAPMGPPPPASARSAPAPAPDAGPPRIHTVAGVEVDEAFFSELAGLVPLVEDRFETQLNQRWDELATRFGIDPRKDVTAAALLRIGPTGGTPRPYLVVEGTFGRDALFDALAKDPEAKAAGFAFHTVGTEKQIEVKGGTSWFRAGARVHLLGDGLAVLTPPDVTEELAPFRASAGSPDPFDLAAVRSYYGLQGTNFFFNMVVTAEQRKTMGRMGGPLAMMGPMFETLGIRVEDGQVQVGATFLSEDTVQQVHGLLGMVLGVARAGLDQALMPAGQPMGPGLPSTPPEGLLSLMRPEEAAKKAAFQAARDWMDGIRIAPAGTSLVLELDREKIPWLRASTLLPLIPVVSAGIPMFMAYQQRAMMQRLGVPGMSGGMPGGMPPGLTGPLPGPDLRKILGGGAAPGPVRGPAPRTTPPPAEAGPESLPPIPVPGR